MIDTTARMTVRAESFVQPVQPGHELLNLSAVAFLIEHEASGRKVMFDLGVRKDYWNYAAVLQRRIGSIIPSLRVDRNVSEILEEGGVGLEMICELCSDFSVCLLMEWTSSFGDLVALPLGSCR